ncbi:MAG: ion transporter [Nitratireductor sp.]|nr:ion transporter [Nitratireductor sp.]
MAFPHKERIADIVWGRDEHLGHLFDYVMIVLIVMVISLMAVQTLPDFPVPWMQRLAFFDWVVILVFTAEYVLRLWTSSRKLGYVVSFWGLVDFLAIAPFWIGLILGLPGAEVLWTLRALRIAKLLRFVANMGMLQRAFDLVWRELLVVLLLAVLMMFCTAVGIYFFEHDTQPQAFPSIPHSFWFAVTTLTTVGYGDAYPITTGGKVFTFVILMIGLGIVALPAGLISSAFTQAREEANARKRQQKDRTRLNEEAQAIADDIDG